MQSPLQLQVVYPPNLFPLSVSTKTIELLASSHFAWNAAALSESAVALYNKFNVSFWLYLLIFFVSNYNS